MGISVSSAVRLQKMMSHTLFQLVQIFVTGKFTECFHFSILVIGDTYFCIWSMHLFACWPWYHQSCLPVDFFKFWAIFQVAHPIYPIAPCSTQITVVILPWSLLSQNIQNPDCQVSERLHTWFSILKVKPQTLKQQKACNPWSHTSYNTPPPPHLKKKKSILYQFNWCHWSPLTL